MTHASDAANQPARARPSRCRRGRRGRCPRSASLRTFTTNSLAACDEELFEELLVERRYFWGRVFVVSDPDGMRRVLQDNTDNYHAPRRVPAHLRVQQRRRHGLSRRRGLVAAPPDRQPGARPARIAARPASLIELTEEMARRLAEIPRGEQFELGRTLQHLITRATGQVWAGDEPRDRPDGAAHGALPREIQRPRPVSDPGRLAFRRRAGARAAPASADITSCSTG